MSIIAVASGTAAALELTDALITVALNAMISAQKAQRLIATARSEGREVSDDELAQIKADNNALTDEVLAKLKVAAEQG